MKIHSFHLMPYPDLPEDFRERYHSVYIDLPTSVYDPARGHEVYNSYLDQLEYAADMGFDGVCVNEHHENAYGLVPSPNIMAASLSRRTNNAGLVVLGTSIALYNPPTRVAEEYAMLDVMSGGRVVAGFPVGTSMDTNYAYGQTPITLRDKYREAHDLIIKAWTERDVFAWNGKFNQLRYVNIWPRPIQKPHPPIWVPGGSNVETWDWVIDHDYLFAHLSLGGHDRSQAVLDAYYKRVEAAGKEYNPYRVGMTQFVMVADNDEQAEELYSEAADYFYNKCLHIYRGFNEAPGYRPLSAVQASIAAGGQTSGMARGGAVTWHDRLDDGSVIAGSPETVTERLRQSIKSLRVGHLMIVVQMGNLPHDRVMNNIRLLSQKVLPNIRDIWSEYEDKWWIHPMHASKRVSPAKVP